MAWLSLPRTLHVYISLYVYVRVRVKRSPGSSGVRGRQRRHEKNSVSCAFLCREGMVSHCLYVCVSYSTYVSICRDRQRGRGLGGGDIFYVCLWCIYVCVCVKVRMYVCMYVSVCQCMYVCICICVYVCMHVCVPVRVSVHACLRTCAGVHVCVYLYPCISGACVAVRACVQWKRFPVEQQKEGELGEGGSRLRKQRQ